MTMWTWITSAASDADRVHLWPLGDEVRQLELAATAVLPAVEG